jgi:competence protein ComEA
MRNYLRDFLTDQEQKILLFLCLFLIFGLSVGSGKKISHTENSPGIDSLSQEAKTKQVVMVDIRTASKEDLMDLPGIGEKRATDILDYRKTHGFKSCYELLEIKGIGPKMIEKIKPNLVWFGADIDTTNIRHVDRKASFSGKVNLNTATLEELMQLPSIGPVKAQAILDKRTEIGSFETTEQIMDVKGIGPKTFEKLKELIIVGD